MCIKVGMKIKLICAPTLSPWIPSEVSINASAGNRKPLAWLPIWAPTRAVGWAGRHRHQGKTPLPRFPERVFLPWALGELGTAGQEVSQSGRPRAGQPSGALLPRSQHFLRPGAPALRDPAQGLSGEQSCTPSPLHGAPSSNFQG